MVENWLKKNHDRQRQAASRGQLPNFAVGDYVMLATVRRPDSTLRLASTWTGPWQILTTDEVHVYGVQNIVTGKIKDM